MLRLINVTTKIGEHQVIHDVSLQIAKGDFVALLGGNGAARQRYLKPIVGLLQPVKGRVEIKGVEIVNAGTLNCKQRTWRCVLKEDSFFRSFRI
jgi:ABC-type branched-subunit amino acid transport system ATPase component